MASGIRRTYRYQEVPSVGAVVVVVPVTVHGRSSNLHRGSFLAYSRSQESV